MNSTATKVSKSLAAIRGILRATFPAVKSRTVSVVFTDTLPSSTDTPWDGGTKTDVRLFNLKTGGVVHPTASDGSVGSKPVAMCGASAEWVIVEHSVFCGKDAGITIRMRRIVSEDVLSVVADRLLRGESKYLAQSTLALEAGTEWSDGLGRAGCGSVTWLVVEARVSAAAKAEKKAQHYNVTSLNLFALTRLANGRHTFPNRIPPTSAPHIRKCMKALKRISEDLQFAWWDRL